LAGRRLTRHYSPKREVVGRRNPQVEKGIRERTRPKNDWEVRRDERRVLKGGQIIKKKGEQNRKNSSLLMRTSLKRPLYFAKGATSRLREPALGGKELEGGNI